LPANSPSGTPDVASQRWFQSTGSNPASDNDERVDRVD